MSSKTLTPDPSPEGRGESEILASLYEGTARSSDFGELSRDETRG
jgi:hypothetical protein